MTITQEILEKFVPSLKSPDEQLYEKLEEFLAREIRALENAEITDETLTTDDLQSMAMRVVCTSAAFEAVPHLDLVATPTGFGVVSNQNVAPASKERVAALREQLRKERSEAYDRLILELLKTDWRSTTSAAYLVHSLVFLPSLLRRYGVKYNEAPVYYEEFQQMANVIARAEQDLEFLISPELHAKLIALQLAESMTTEEQLTIEQARLYLATHINKTHPRSLDVIARRLLETIRKAGFEEYLNSSTYAAQTFTPYQNEQQHPTFFFS